MTLPWDVEHQNVGNSVTGRPTHPLDLPKGRSTCQTGLTNHERPERQAGLVHTRGENPVFAFAGLAVEVSGPYFACTLVEIGSASANWRADLAVGRVEIKSSQLPDASCHGIGGEGVRFCTVPDRPIE